LSAKAEAEQHKEHVSYLLGRLSDEDAQALEERYFRDSDLFERLRALETDLLDDYARGELAGQDRSDFERRLESSPLLRSRLESAVAIQRAFALGSADAEAAPPAGQHQRPLPRRPGLAWLAGLGAAAAVVLAVVGLNLHRENGQLLTGIREAELVERRLEEENRSLHREISARPPAPNSSASASPIVSVPVDVSGRVFSFRLVPGLLRDLHASNDVVVPKGIAAVVLEVPVGSGTGWRYRVRVETISGDLVLDQANVAASKRRGGDVAVLAFPASSIPAGDYVLKVARRRDGAPSEPVSDLAFRIAYN
jgi:hypothetical protein